METATVALAALLLAQATAPQGSAAPPGAVLAGVVVDAVSGAPIPGAVVEALTLDRRGPVARRPEGTRAGLDGRWRLTDQPPGIYRLVARAPGFAAAWVEAPVSGRMEDTPADGRTFRVSPGLRWEGLRARLSRAGRISGRVTNPAGMPVPDAGVLVEGDVVSPVIAPVVTDAEGHYTLDAGVGERVLVVLPNRVPSSRAPDRGWRRVFYPGTLKRSEARSVTVRAGEHVADLDIIVPLPSAHTVTGQIVVPGGATDVGVQLLSNFGRTLRALSFEPRDGTLRAEAIDAGYYVVWARAMDGDTALAAWQLVDVVNDVELQPLVLVATGTVRGRVRAAPGRVALHGATTVGSVLSAFGDGFEILGERDAPVAADGFFELTGVFGPRRFVVRGLPPAWEVLDIRVGGTSVLAAGITVGGGDVIDGVEVIVGPRP